MFKKLGFYYLCLYFNVLFTLDLQDRFKAYMDCVQYCYNGRCAIAKNKTLCLCNDGYIGDNCSKRKSVICNYKI